ncbi:MAG: type I-B CRISPR-associated protein Cas7/Cst2/DevR [Cyanobacteria bacterium]|nr:type I-B CRISPR-associated protein Cas7/Cst2/DevR [Cyanobacteriota bacterium]
MNKNLFATVLTYPAPSSNYRGESEQNRTILQKITHGKHEYAVISPEAIRNALREIFWIYDKDICNRERLHNEEQLAVRFKDFPYPERYIDDFFFGYLVADRKQVPNDVQKERNFQFKRDSILRNNLAVALEPYRHDTVFSQSPQNSKDSKWKNADNSQLLHREESLTAFQYPFALNLNDCKLDDSQHGEKFKQWLQYLLKAIAELNGVAGNAARSYFEMQPASIVMRLTPSLVANYSTYGFKPDGTFPEVINGILQGDYPGHEFYFGGVIVREKLDEETQNQLKQKGVHLYRMANQALDVVSQEVTGQGFLLNAPAVEKVSS